MTDKNLEAQQPEDTHEHLSKYATIVILLAATGCVLVGGSLTAVIAYYGDLPDGCEYGHVGKFPNYHCNTTQTNDNDTLPNETNGLFHFGMWSQVTNSLQNAAEQALSYALGFNNS